MTEETKMMALAKALNAAQGEMRGAVKDSENTFFKKTGGSPSTYADLSAVFLALNKPFFNNGLSVSQPIEVVGDKMHLVTNIYHIGGGCLTSRMILPDMEKPQSFGAAITYFRRFSLQSLAGIPAIDDDGNEVEKAVIQQKENKAAAQLIDPIITPETVTNIEQVISTDDKLRQELLELCKIKTISQMKQSQIEIARKYVTKYQERKNASS